MKESALDILALFPSFESERFGGIQGSGRDAWRGIVSRVGQERACALHYEPGCSKAKTVLRAVRSRKRSRVILVWHLHLLKLLPFLDTSRSRVVLFLHGVEAWLKQDLLTRIILRKVHLILSNSDHTWDRFLGWNPEFQQMAHRTVHLGAGSCLGAATPCYSHPPIVLMIGRLQKSENYKGHQQMIEGWPLVLQRNPEARLWIVGGGDLLPNLERIARESGLQEAVRFFGEVPDTEKERLIAQSRCLALPSRGEGFGLVYLEAMRLGRPCLVSDLDAGREVVNPPEAGLAIDSVNPEEIADAVDRLLSPGAEWEQWSARARGRYEQRFTAEQFQHRLVAALFEG